MGNQQSSEVKRTPGFLRLDDSESSKQAYTKYVDLACRSQGGRIVDVSDEFFASADNLLQSHEAVSKPNTYTENGAWMDGWETRRHNPDHDWVIIKLGFAGTIGGFDIDTGHFNGNQAPAASVEACFVSEERLKQGGNIDFDWEEVLPRVDLGPASKHYFLLNSPTSVFNFVRLRIYPDGGVGRFRVYGAVQPVWPATAGKQLLDLAFVGSGGQVVAQSNQHYTPSSHLILPGRGQNMGDGWETKRSRVSDHCDWVVVRLGSAGRLEKCDVDTHYFRGNFPESVELHACNSILVDPSHDADCAWFQVLPRQRLSAHQQHHFSLDLRDRVFTHVRMTIYPDGGVMRLRVYGRPVLPDQAENDLSPNPSKSASSTPSRAARASLTNTPSGAVNGTGEISVIDKKKDMIEVAAQVAPAVAVVAATARATQRKRSRRERVMQEDGDYMDPSELSDASVASTTASKQKITTTNGKKRGRRSVALASPTPVAKKSA